MYDSKASSMHIGGCVHGHTSEQKNGFFCLTASVCEKEDGEPFSVLQVFDFWCRNWDFRCKNPKIVASFRFFVQVFIFRCDFFGVKSKISSDSASFHFRCRWPQCKFWIFVASFEILMQLSKFWCKLEKFGASIKNMVQVSDICCRVMVNCDGLWVEG